MSQTLAPKFWLLLPVAMFLAGVVATWPHWYELFCSSLQDGGAGYAILAFPIAVTLAWCRRTEVCLMPQGNWVGALVLVTGLGALGLGCEKDITTLSHAGANLVACGAFCSVITSRSIRSLLPVGLILVLVVGIPGSVSGYVAIPLAHANAKFVGFVLGRIGFPVEVLGTTLICDSFELHVVDACDGLRLLWAVWLLSYATCCFSRISWKRTSLLLAMAPVIALVANCFRIVSVAIAFAYTPSSVATAIHDVSGWAMMSCAWLLPLAMLWHSPVEGARVCSREERAEHVSKGTQRAPGLMVIATFYILVFLGYIASIQDRVVASSSLSSVKVQSCLDSLPYRLNDYVAEDHTVPKRQMEILKPDAFIGRRFHNLSTGHEFLLVVSYHQNGRLHAAHDVLQCYSNLGWKQLSSPEWRATNDSVGMQHVVCSFARKRVNFTEQIVVHKTSFEPVAQTGNHSSQNTRIQIQFVFDAEIPSTERWALLEEVSSELQAYFALVSSQSVAESSDSTNFLALGGFSRVIFRGNCVYRFAA